MTACSLTFVRPDGGATAAGLSSNRITPTVDTLALQNARARSRLESGEDLDCIDSNEESVIMPPAASSTAPDEGGEDDTLAAFYERGITSSTWTEFAGAHSPARLLYAGSPFSNLHQLVRCEDPSATLHYPYPPIRRSPASSAEGGLLSSSADVTVLPSAALRDALIATYFEDIQPGLLIVNEAEFRRDYHSGTNPPPLLLLQCVLLAAARVSTHPVVARDRAGFTGRIYRRAKALFEARHENDRMLLVQAALLLAWYVGDSDTVSSGPYYWVGLAARFAFGLGMHRDLTPTAPSLMPYPDRRLYRRIWWAVVRYEAWVAIEFGRPSMLHLTESDQAQLTETDLVDDTPRESLQARLKSVIIDTSMAKLALTLTQAASEGQDHNSQNVDAELMAIAAALPLPHDFLSNNTRMQHSVLILLVHRAKTGLESAVAMQEAASGVLVMLETMLARNVIHRCSYFVSTAILAAGLHFYESIRQCGMRGASSGIRAMTAHAQLERLLVPAEAVAAFWPHVSAICSLLVVFIRRGGQWMDGSIEMDHGVGMDTELSFDEILANYDFTSLGGDKSLWDFG